MHFLLYSVLLFSFILLYHHLNADDQLPDTLTITGYDAVLPALLPAKYIFKLSKSYPKTTIFIYQIHLYIRNIPGYDPTNNIKNETITSNSSIVEYQLNDDRVEKVNVQVILAVKVYIHEEDNGQEKLIAKRYKYVDLTDENAQFFDVNAEPINRKLIVTQRNGQPVKFVATPREGYFHQTAMTAPNTSLTYHWIITGPNRKFLGNTTHFTFDLSSYTANFTRVGNYSAVCQIKANISGQILQFKLTQHFQVYHNLPWYLLKRIQDTTIYYFFKDIIDTIIFYVNGFFLLILALWFQGYG